MQAQKVKVFLHGNFGQTVGPEWELYAKTPAQALRLIEANTKKVFKFLTDIKERNVNYQILIGDQPISSEQELNCGMGKQQELHFVPVPEGAKSGLGKILAAIAIIVVVFVLQQYEFLPTLAQIGGAGGAAAAGFGATSAYVTLAAYSVATSLIVGGITQIIVGNPKTSGYSSEENEPSYIFNGPINTTRQGNPVPLCYGKMLCGSALITLQVSSTDISVPVVTDTNNEDYSGSGEMQGGGTALVSGNVLNTGYITNSPFNPMGRPQEI